MKVRLMIVAVALGMAVAASAAVSAEAHAMSKGANCPLKAPMCGGGHEL
jgi:hypothetical protein